MLKCLIEGKELLASELKDSYGVYKDNEREQIRLQGYNNNLFCPCCNEPVRLGAGNIREPYFAHKDIKQCIYSKEYSEEVQKIKLKLYKILKSNFIGDVSVDYFHNNKFFSNILLQYDNKNLALEFFMKSNIRKINSKIQKYKNIGINFFAIIFDSNNNGIYNNKNSVEYYASINNPEGIVAYIYDDKYELHKFSRLYGMYQKRFTKCFDIDSFNISIDGTFDVKFEEEKSKQAEEIPKYESKEEKRVFSHVDKIPSIETNSFRNEIIHTNPKSKNRTFNIYWSGKVNLSERAFVNIIIRYLNTSHVKDNLTLAKYTIMNHYDNQSNMDALRNYAYKYGNIKLLDLIEQVDNLVKTQSE